ncbi:hypothetical protein MG293_013879 [Ovis ammon polii]|uniref:Uncharacterized protein n=1 Tax=Ovis ammon polii TaxID=230172 RepID=A0AAD4Y6Q8_OVIAM|nr:hypothetical protein MG293_013879 [Ovis ammon polii]KAI4557571.1 hypothetical protein MJT46_014250 [Ovis ammon polii x Ovis aries]
MWAALATARRHPGAFLHPALGVGEIARRGPGEGLGAHGAQRQSAKLQSTGLPLCSGENVSSSGKPTPSGLLGVLSHRALGGRSLSATVGQLRAHPVGARYMRDVD